MMMRKKREKNVSFGIGKKCGEVERGNYGDSEKETEMKETKNRERRRVLGKIKERLINMR